MHKVDAIPTSGLYLVLSKVFGEFLAYLSAFLGKVRLSWAAGLLFCWVPEPRPKPPMYPASYGSWKQKLDPWNPERAFCPTPTDIHFA